MYQNIIKIPSFMFLLGMSFFLVGAGSEDETFEADIFYDLALKNAVRQMNGTAEEVDLKRVNANEFEDEFVNFKLNPDQYNTFLFEVTVQGKIMDKPYDLNPMSVRSWIEEVKEDISISREGASTFDDRVPRVFRFFPEKQMAPFSYKGPRQGAKAVLGQAEKFKGTNVILVVPVSLDNQVTTYHFVFDVQNVVSDER